MLHVCTYTQVLYIKPGCPAEGSFETECEKAGKLFQRIDNTEITQTGCMLRPINYFSESPTYKWRIDVIILSPF